MTVTVPVWSVAVVVLSAGGVGMWAGFVAGRRRRVPRWETHRQQTQTAHARARAEHHRQVASELTRAITPATVPPQQVIVGQVVAAAGTDVPPRGTGLPDTAVLARDARRWVDMVDDALDVHPPADDPPRDETRVTRLGDDTDTGGTAVAGAVAHRYVWPVWTGQVPPPKPMPWRAPVRALHTRMVLVYRRAVGVWQPADRWQQLCDRLRVAGLAVVGRYRAVGRHADRVLHTRSWSEVAEERRRQWAAEAAALERQAHRLIRQVQAGSVRRPVARTVAAVPPMVGCTP